MPPTEEDIAWFKSTFHPIPKAALPDDCIEYSIHILSSSLDAANDSELRLRLRDAQKYAADLQKEWLKDYIWQRQGFALELQKEDGVSFLRGRTEYGDSIEDEWVIVWLLREISRKFSDSWIKVTDSDGEFLLIEASASLPYWLEPDVAENRVWINDGQLKIVKPASASRSSKRTSEKLSLQDARQIISDEPKRLMHSSSIEQEAFHRLRNYPAQIKTNIHHALVTIPRRVAFLLKQKASYISPAIEAFYLRDPISLKPLNSKEAMETMTFPPKDPVTVSVRFPKVGYAQLKSQDFPIPAVFRKSMAQNSEPELKSWAETGVKVTCGFEMLLSDSQHQDKPAVREMKLLLDDLATGDESLPSDTEIEHWSKQEDDEKWLDIDFNDLEKELGGSKGASDKKRDFGDKGAQENLQRIVKQFEEFLKDDEAGPDGAGLFDEDSDDDAEDGELEDEGESDGGEDKDISFDEDEFSKMMQEMMGMPPEVMKEIMSGKLGAETSNTRQASDPKASGHVEELDDNSAAEEDEDMKQMEAELREHGALNLNPAAGPGGSSMHVLKDGESSDLSDNDDEGENDADVNLARNLLESFKAQAGVAGPGGNIIGLMGMTLPRDVGDQDAAGPSKGKSKR